MSDLLIKFKLDLEYHPIPSGSLYIPHPHGPLFHRWLPGGETDAIELDTKDPKATLRVWLEMHGYLRDGYIEFDREKREIAPEVVPTQGKLDGGPLYGLLTIRDINDSEARWLKGEVEDIETSKNFEKRIIDLLYNPVSQFLDVLRTRYGQYWIPEIEKWDSRKMSAGVFIRGFGFPRWSLDGGKTWDTFQNVQTRLSVGELRKRQDYREYLSEKDWRDIKNLTNNNWRPSQAISTLIRAIELFDNGEVKYAIVEAVTALEMALSEVVRERLLAEGITDYNLPLEKFPFVVQLTLTGVIPSKKEKSRSKDQSLQLSAENALSKFRELDLSEQFNVIANLFSLAENDRRATLQIIGMRNDIVHEGKSPPTRHVSEFSGLLNCFVQLYADRHLRFPMAGPGNRKLTAQEWENLRNE